MTQMFDRRSAMPVRDLVANSIWEPGSCYVASEKPIVSFLLPTFRRARGGRFERAVRSVLDQTLSDLELIIVDDASTDGTAAMIRRLMAEDGRISCIWHPENIGLPAVSEYEAFLKSRGQFIAFSFDDFEFEPDASERLVDAARLYPNEVVHGCAKLVFEGGNFAWLGKEPVPHDNLTFANFIANGSFLVPRDLLEEVGLYCPHVAGSRLCDWDLWLRILRRRFIRRTDIFVGSEHGIGLPESLGRNHPLNIGATQELYGLIGEGQLGSARFADYDVWAMPPGSSARLALATLEARKFYSSKTWASQLALLSADEVATLIDPPEPQIGIVGQMDASFSIFFATFASRHAGRVKFVALDIDLQYSMAVAKSCDALVFVRCLLEPMADAFIQLARALDIDRYYFTDDNFVVLAREGLTPAEYTNENIRRRLTEFKGVFVGSQPLKSYFDDYQLHKDVRLLKGAWDDSLRSRLALLPRETHDALRIAFIGNATRQPAFFNQVLPAIVALSRRQAVEVFVPASVDLGTEKRDFRITAMPATGSYNEFLASWRPLGIDVVVHPKGESANQPYKNAHVMLTAWYLGAGLIVDTEEEAFKDVDDQSGVRSAAGTEGWLDALVAVSNPASREEWDRRLEAAVLRRFDPGLNDEILWSVLADTRPHNILDMVKEMPIKIEYRTAQPMPPPPPITLARKRRSFGQKVLREFARLGKRYLDQTN